MKKFENLEKGNVKDIEQKQIDKWKEQDILNKTIENRKDNLRYRPWYERHGLCSLARHRQQG